MEEEEEDLEGLHGEEGFRRSSWRGKIYRILGPRQRGDLGDWKMSWAKLWHQTHLEKNQVRLAKQKGQT